VRHRQFARRTSIDNSGAETPTASLNGVRAWLRGAAPEPAARDMITPLPAMEEIMSLEDNRMGPAVDKGSTIAISFSELSMLGRSVCPSE
jgi:hypothetical protein